MEKKKEVDDGKIEEKINDKLVKIKKKFSPDQVNDLLGTFLENLTEEQKQRLGADDFVRNIDIPEFSQELIKVDLNAECKGGRYKLKPHQRVMIITENNILWLLETIEVKSKGGKQEK